jgi:hypothetical protein
MKRTILSGSIASLWLVCGFAATAQTPADNQTSPAATITVAGCVQPEKDVLKRNAAVGDVGMSDEFVLIHSALNPKPAADEPKPAEPPAEAPVGTSGSASNFGKIYRVTGDKEKELKPFVNQRVEITGAFKNETGAKAEIASVGTKGTAGESPANTPEITITAIKPIAGMCTSVGAK